VNQRALTLALGCICGGLLAVVMWQGRELRLLRAGGVAVAVAPAETPEVAESSSSNPDGLAEAQPALPSAPLAQRTNPPAIANRVLSHPAPDWRTIESEDYLAYIRNLRATGCPEQTVRDIVSADVVQAYAAKRAAVVAAAYHDFKYWAAGDEKAMRAAIQRDRRAVDEEMNGTLTDLLGNQVLPPETEREWSAAILDEKLDYLSPDKRDAVRATLLRNADIETQVAEMTSNHPPTDDLTELKRIMDTYDSVQTTLAQSLTPEELAQLQMSVTTTATNVRRRLADFNPTEDEYKMIFAAWYAQDIGLARKHLEGFDDPGNLQGPVHEQIRQQLSEERYAQYRASWR
jgi:hypothetical protein